MLTKAQIGIRYRNFKRRRPNATHDELMNLAMNAPPRPKRTKEDIRVYTRINIWARRNGVTFEVAKEYLRRVDAGEHPELPEQTRARVARTKADPGPAVRKRAPNKNLPNLRKKDTKHYQVQSKIAPDRYDGPLPSQQGKVRVLCSKTSTVLGQPVTQQHESLVFPYEIDRLKKKYVGLGYKVFYNANLLS